MNRQILTFVILILSATVAFSQTATPTPGGGDVQNVAPEDIKGVPSIGSFGSAVMMCPCSS